MFVMTKTQEKALLRPTKTFTKSQRTRVYAIVYGRVIGANGKTHDTRFGGPAANPLRKHHSTADHKGERELLRGLLPECGFSGREEKVLLDHHDRLCRVQTKRENAETVE